MNLNKAMIIGNLTRDPETRTTPGGQSVCNFGVATNLVWTDQSGEKQKRVEFHNVVAWRKLAEICSQYLRKGNKVYIEGRLQTRDWEAQDGSKRQRTEIIAENMIMLDTKGSYSGADTPAAESAPKKPESQPEAPSDSPSGDDEIKVEDIPF